MWEFIKYCFNNVFLSLLSSGTVTVIMFFVVLRKLPDKTGKAVRNAMDTKVISINQFTDKSNSGGHNTLSAEHKGLSTEHQQLSKHHTEIKQDLRDLIADMHRRQGSITDANNAVKLSEKIQETLIKQNEDIQQLNKKIEQLNKELINEKEKNKKYNKQMQKKSIDISKEFENEQKGKSRDHGIER